MGHVSYRYRGRRSGSVASSGATLPDSCGGGLRRDRRRLDPIRVTLFAWCVVLSSRGAWGERTRVSLSAAFGRVCMLYRVRPPYPHN